MLVFGDVDFWGVCSKTLPFYRFQPFLLKKSPGSEVMIWEQNPPPMLRLFVFTVAHNVQRYIDLNSRFHQTPVFSETHQKFVWQKARNWSGQETTQVSIGPRSRETNNLNISFGILLGV